MGESRRSLPIFRSWFAFSDIALPVEKLNDSGHAFDFGGWFEPREMSALVERGVLQFR